VETLTTKPTRRCALKILPGAVLLRRPLDALAQPQDRLTALVVDVTGVETEVYDLRTNGDPFDRGWGSHGFQMTVKKYVSSAADGHARYERWFYFDQIETLTVQKSGALGVKLRSGDQISGEFASGGPIRGQWSQGTFELPWDKVKSITVKGKVARPVVSVTGPKGTVVLWDGTSLAAHDLLRYSVVNSRYINVSPSHYYGPDLWIKYKRGAGLVKTSVPFGKIDEIILVKPVPGRADPREIKLVLRDASVISGTLGGDGGTEDFNGVAGRSQLGPFWIVGWPSLGQAIQSIKFSQ
jgi:hypothetical protein